MTTMVNIEDIPSKEELIQGVTRLRKCAKILIDFRSSKKKDEDPAALQRIANFLEMMAKK